MTSLTSLFEALADAFDAPIEIERDGRAALLAAATAARYDGPATALAAPFVDVMTAPDAHPACALLAAAPLPWAPPQTSTDPAYLADNVPKAHVELLGPDGLVQSDTVRLGVYGILPHSEYGLRTHPAEEVFVMLAGTADWWRGNGLYQSHGTGARSHHASMLPHATRTGALAFMSLYAWTGDVATDNYTYHGRETLHAP